MAITVLVAYRTGTKKVLETCLESFFRHTDNASVGGVELRILYDSIHGFDAEDVVNKFNVSIFDFTTDEKTGSLIHGSLLDQAIPSVSSEYLLTLDSDCFAIADGWLDELKAMIDGGAAVAGILYPWQPIPEGVMKGAIEKRIRQHHCWERSQVVCQLTKTEFARSNNISYRAGDDTGFMVSELALRFGLQIKGWKPTRCLLPGKEIDPEFNRHIGVVYGDKVYHQGGATQAICGRVYDPGDVFSQSAKQVLDNLGAEFLLEEGKSYKYKFDREEEVADFKMQMMYTKMAEYLKTHDSLFDKI